MQYGTGEHKDLWGTPSWIYFWIPPSQHVYLPVNGAALKRFMPAPPNLMFSNPHYRRLARCHSTEFRRSSSHQRSPVELWNAAQA
jgi:hypothetical protein